MSDRTLENGWMEIEIEMSKTIQEDSYEPLRIRTKVRKMVKEYELDTEIRKYTEIMENEICDALGLPPIEVQADEDGGETRIRKEPR